MPRLPRFFDNNDNALNAVVELYNIYLKTTRCAVKNRPLFKL